MYQVNLPAVPAPVDPKHCSRCASRYTSYSGGPREVTVRFSCATAWQTKWDQDKGQWVTTEDFRCKVGDKAICANCSGTKCMHFVCRDWENVEKCDGWCCPDCRPVSYAEPLPENWRDLN